MVNFAGTGDDEAYFKLFKTKRCLVFPAKARIYLESPLIIEQLKAHDSFVPVKIRLKGTTSSVFTLKRPLLEAIDK